MAFSATDCPNKIDLLLNGEAYMFAEPEETEAQYTFTPTFVPRTNTQGDYGDNQQDFFLNTNMSDWSLGEGQKFYRRDEERRRRYWRGAAVDTSVPGQVSLGRAKELVTATARQSICSSPYQSNVFYAASSSTLYTHDSTGTETSKGSHGLTNGPSRWGMVSDGDNIYLSNNTITAIRKWDEVGDAFSTFSATNAGSLAFLNNTLWGYNTGSQALYYYSTGGVASTAHTWLDADGNASAGVTADAKLVPYGGKLAVIRGFGSAENLTGQIWMADTTGASSIAAFPAGFAMADACVAYGSLIIAGSIASLDGAGRATLLIYDNGSLDVLWAAPYTGDYANAVCPFVGGIAFTQSARDDVSFYNLTTGSVTTLFSGIEGAAAYLAGGYTTFLLRDGTNGESIFPSQTTLATSGYVQTSLDDFDSSLTKIFRGITVDYVAGSGGNGGSVDIAYRVGDVDGSYTSLQTSAASGTEYTLSSVTGKAISVKVTINKGTATTPPVLKKITVRAVPLQASYRKNLYVLALGGVDGENNQQFRDGTFHPNDGQTQALALKTVATTGTPVTVVDEIGSYTGVIDNEGFQLRRVRKNEYIAVVPVREV